MAGSVVQKYDCSGGGSGGGAGNDATTTAMDLTTSVLNATTAAAATGGGGGATFSPDALCRIGIAASVMFFGGLLQVCYMPCRTGGHYMALNVSNQQPYDCLLNRLFGRWSKNTASMAFVRGIHRWPANSPHKGPVTRKMFPFDDVIMQWLDKNDGVPRELLSNYNTLTHLIIFGHVKCSKLFKCHKCQNAVNRACSWH